jgi:transglutaminase-like putative cysteine protease
VRHVALCGYFIAQVKRLGREGVPIATIITIRHRTEYTYDRPVLLNPHRLMLRPRDGHDLWVDDAFLTIRPRARLRWYFDTFGNSVAEASFFTPTEHLLIESELVLRRYVTDRVSRTEGARLCPYPISYSPDDARDLSPFLALQNPGDAEVLDRWLAENFSQRATDAVGLLHDLSESIHRHLRYSAREEMGTQTAAQTIQIGIGTCRDFAFLFIEAARRFGFAARFVTGYLNDTPGAEALHLGGGSTHAWADVFVPNEGWIEFDPTNQIAAGSALIRIATTRTPAQASPISGSFKSDGGICLGLSVSVEVREATDPS